MTLARVVGTIPRALPSVIDNDPELSYLAQPYSQSHTLLSISITTMSSSRPSSTKQSKSPAVPDTAPSPRSPLLPYFDDPLAPQDEPPEEDPPYDIEAEAEDDNEIAYPEPSSEQTLLPPPNFNPFFILIEDSTSSEHYHPYVHYVFADDDPVIVTAAAMRSLGLDDTQYLPHNISDGEEDKMRNEEAEQEQGSDTQVESPLPPPIPGVQERYMIVDVAADGHTIVDAQSLSSDWQITDANVRPAPSFDEASPEHGYMLRIEGIEVTAKRKGKAKGEPGDVKLKEARDMAQGDVFAALDGLVKSIESSLHVAGKITGGRETVRESDVGTAVLETAAIEEEKDSV